MVYVYAHPQTGETREVVQSIHDVHEYVVDGVKWHRVFNSVNIAVDTKVDPFSSKDFIKKTDKPGTVGDLIDRSKEMAEKRKEKAGFDPILQKEVESYEKQFKVKHPSKISKL